MTRRMLTALVALVGVFVSLYLALYKAGVIGTIACGAGGCETVQFSRWATLIGVPIAVWGIGYYVAVFGLAFAGTLERWEESAGVSALLLVFTAWGVVFSAWLTYLELFVINAICRWCVVSAVLAVVLFALALSDWMKKRRSAVSRNAVDPHPV